MVNDASGIRLSPGLFGLDVGRPDYLSPLLGFLSDELAELGGRAGKWGFAEIGKPRLHLGIGEASVDPLVELADDLSWRARRHADPVPVACLVARHELTHGRDVRQRVLARRSGYCERAQPASPDILNR